MTCDRQRNRSAVGSLVRDGGLCARTPNYRPHKYTSNVTYPLKVYILIRKVPARGLELGSVQVWV